MGKLVAGLVAAVGQVRRDTAATLRMIQFEHTVFALPFALMGAVLAARGLPSGVQLFWILMAMVGARSAAMTFNRLADLSYDQQNPRTAERPLVTGVLSKRFAWIFLLLSCLLFIFSAVSLNRLAGILSLPVLALVLGYSYAKRYMWGTHFWLGASLGCAPLGAWIAVRGEFQAAPVFLGLAVLCWTAGFDIIYACQDVEFDRRAQLHSIPKRWGIGRALLISRLLHASMLVLLFLIGRMFSLGGFFLAGLLGTATLLLYEHSLVKPDDLSRVNRAFFTMNGYVSLFLLGMTLADIYWPR